jgi:hypothetical protein
MDKRAFWIGMWLAASLSALGGPTNQPAERSCLGQTVEQCDQRYGTPVETKRPPGGSETWVSNIGRSYKRDGLSISVGFVGGKAVRIQYDAPSAILDAEKLQGLMDINTQERTWSLPVKSQVGLEEVNYYSSDGGWIRASLYHTSPNTTRLLVCSPEAFTPAYIEKNKAEFREHSKTGTTDGL